LCVDFATNILVYRKQNGEAWLKMPFSLTGGSTARAYDLAYTVLAGVILVAVLPFALLSLVKNKHGKDPARKFVPWLKSAFLVFIV
jgi:hypothetical protein